MITIEDIDKDLIQYDSSVEIDRDFVAAAVILDKLGHAKHSGFLISYRKTIYFFHWMGGDVELEPVKFRNCFYKELKFIKETEVLAFYVHCVLVQANARPIYGYFYAGDYYDNEGKYFSESGLQEYMTCVGFCINVMKGFLEGMEYFAFEDWNADGSPEGYFEEFLIQFQAQNPGVTIDEKLFKSHLRRITPAEFTSGAYLEIVIRKNHIDEIVESVKAILLGRLPKTET